MLLRIARLPRHLSRQSQQEESLQELFDVLGVRGSGDIFPRVDLIEHENEVHILAEVPGVKKDDVKVSLRGRDLELSGKRSRLGLSEEWKHIHSESWNGSFSRVLHLPCSVHSKGISATVQNGVLEIILPKAEESRLHEITVA